MSGIHNRDSFFFMYIIFSTFFQKIDGEIRAQIEEATKKAKTDKEIGFDELSADIYAGPIDPKIRNIDPFNPLTHKNINKPINL